MSENATNDVTTVTLEPFPSAAALRTAHNELLNREEDVAALSSAFVTEVETFIVRGRITGALLETDEERTASQSILNYWKSFLYGVRHKAPVATLEKFDPHLFPDTTKEKPSPYVGLSAFQEADHTLFFGRKRAVSDALERLRVSNFVAVVGFSGSGKSSLVLAGLLPALKAGALPGSMDWRYLGPMVPGPDPLLSLARVLTPLGQEQLSPTLDATRQQLLSDSKALLTLIDGGGESPSVLVIDQFEEIFTLVGDDRQAERDAFCANLAALVATPAACHKVVVTMRGDKKGQLLKVPSLLTLFRAAPIEIAELDAGELREAILAPAAHVGLKFEDGIVDALIKEIIGEPAGLPLLQFALLKLWDEREHSRVTWDAYRRLGGARRALGRSADELYKSLVPSEQVVAKRLILRLVRAGTGLEGDRNRVLRGSLLSLGNVDVVERVLNKLAAASLVRVVRGSKEKSSPEDQIEVAHEALIQNWETLAGWLQDERVAIRQRERLTQFAENWRNRGNEPDDLLRGSFLYEAQGYFKEHPEDLNELEKEFLKTSADTLDRQVNDANRRAEEANEFANEKARWARILNLMLVGLSVLTIIIVIVGVVLVFKLNGKYRESHVRELSYKAIDDVRRNQTSGAYGTPLGLSLALKAVYVSHELGQPWIMAYGEQHFPRIFPRPHDAPDSQWALDLATQSAASKLLLGDAHYKPTSIIFSRSGDLAVTVALDNKVRIWEPAREKEILKVDADVGTPILYPRYLDIDSQQPSTLSLQCDPAVTRVAAPKTTPTFFEAQALRIPKALPSEERTIPSEERTIPIPAPAVSADGDYLLSAGSEGAEKATIWALRSGSGCRLRTLVVGRTVTAVAFGSKSHILAAASGDGKIKLWKVEDAQYEKELLLTLGPNNEHVEIQSIAFSPDDKFLAAGSSDGTLMVWEIASSKELFSRNVPISENAPKSAIVSIVFSPDNEHFVTTSLNSTVWIWNIEGSGPQRLFEGDHAEVPTVAFSGLQARRFVAVWGTVARVWETQSGSNGWRELVQMGRQVSFSPIVAMNMNADRFVVCVAQ